MQGMMASVTRTALRRRLAQSSALARPLPCAWQAQSAPSLVALTIRPISTTPAAAKPKILAAKSIVARMRRKNKKPTKPGHHLRKDPKKRAEEQALKAASTANVSSEPDSTKEERMAEAAASAPDATAADQATAETKVAKPPQKAKKQNIKPPLPAPSPPAPTSAATAPAPAPETTSSETTTTDASTPSALPANSQPLTLRDHEADQITMTLKEIENLQKTLPSVEDIASLVKKLRRESFVKGQTLFDLYRIYGNPFLDENFLQPGVLACCRAKKPAQGIKIVRDMLSQGRKVDEETLRALLDVCDETWAAVEVVELWELMERAGVKVTLKDLNRFLDICHRKDYLDGAIRVLRELRLHRSINVHTYMHWLNQATLVWRSDAFFDLLMEMRLSSVEPEILSLTSLESGRMDRALTVMEGVRAVGLDPCFAMSAVFSSMQYSVYKNGPAAEAITKSAVIEARSKFGDLKPVHIDWPVKPIPQVLETQAAGLILQQETFRRLKRSQVHRIDELLQMLPITTNMTINLRKQLQRMSLLVNTHRVRRDARKISAEYDSGKSLIGLSIDHNYPPVSLMRIILKERGLSMTGVKRALGSPSTHLSKRDQYELRKATEYDSIHRSDPFISAAAYNADSLETTIEHFLRARGIRFMTEEELGKQQTEKYGRRVLSPDILLLDPVVVNGTPIRWIDAKNYYGAHIVSKRLISKQLAAYVKEWGPGAIVFGMGYSDMFSLPGVLCLDTTPFPGTRKDMLDMRAKSLFHSMMNVFSWKKHLGSELTQEYPMLVDLTTPRKPKAICADEGHEEAKPEEEATESVNNAKEK